jgi:hypothetical protein
MTQGELPERWQNRLQAYLSEIGVSTGHLSAYEFSDHLKLNFADGSFAFFYYALELHDEALNEVAVFTEHCGYHIFPWKGTDMERMNSVETVHN